MAEDKQKFTTVDAYVDAAAPAIGARLAQMRSIIRAALPAAQETISYNIPAYKSDGVLVVSFAGYTAHTSLSFYPTEAVYRQFADQLAPYRTTKSSIAFDLAEPLPAELVDAIVRFRADEAADYAARKRAGA